MRLPIQQQREIARLHFYDLRTSNRAIGASMQISPTTVGDLRNLLRAQQLTWTDLQALDDEGWRRALKTHDRSIAQRKPIPDWGHVHAEMQRPDATLEQLWQEWRETCPEGVGYTQFSVGYREWRKRQHVVMRQVHRPGEKLFTDFAGRTVEVRDANGGESIYAQVFVAVLGYSNYTYVEAVATQTTPDWVQCNVNCFHALGGAPNWVVSDNLKAAVLRRERDIIVLNPTYREALAHYSTAAAPARARKPRDKGKVEVGVQIAQRWILFRLRDRVFFSLTELNAEIQRLTVALNDHPFKKLDGTRRLRFEQTERGQLKPLPAVAFELCEWRYQVRVGDDYHVEHHRSHYSVPCYLAGERVDLRSTKQVLEIFRGGRRVALHALKDRPGEASTLTEHRPLSHQRVLEGEPASLQAWSNGVGPNSAKMIRYHLEDRSDPVNGLRAARKMRELARTYGEERFEAVCSYALPLNMTSLRNITSILSTQADLRPRPNPQPQPMHQNLRGPDYFGESQ
ncbi:IS21 family transposase [Caenimonas sedimenti]|uniref:IS21 family transposase n=1 Tax=Caenimonas sedimenti TaxID=2596921 RepID=A0A562ZEG4_9BURK|nr:IS21 family transposase [Caenimonas sedimenti]TWO64408.1 IS21 family transposase [Caenimonas sedimenti]